MLYDTTRCLLRYPSNEKFCTKRETILFMHDPCYNWAIWSNMTEMVYRRKCSNWVKQMLVNCVFTWIAADEHYHLLTV